MKKKALISSILTIALCLSLIAGSTFALFTSTDEVNVAITAGKVEVVATIDGLQTYSMENATDVNGTFANGGTASFTDTKALVLDKVTPGDKATFSVNITNNSNVATAYRIRMIAEGELASALVATAKINGSDVKLSTVESVTDWVAFNGNETVKVDMSVLLPVEAGNEYQEKSAKVTVVVEAIQGNGKGTILVDGKAYDTWDAAIAAAGANGTVQISGTVELAGVAGTSQVTDLAGLTIEGLDFATLVFVNAEGSNTTGTGTFANMNLKNLTVVDETFYTGENGENAWEFTYLEFGGTNTFDNVVFTDGIFVEDGKSTFTNCSFIGHNNDSSEYGNGTMYAAWVYSGEASFTNCDFTGTRGLKVADQYAGSDVTAVTVDKCTFGPLSEKPGIAVDNRNGALTLTIKNSTFKGTQAGDAANGGYGVPYVYENDNRTPADTNIVLENNVYPVDVATEEELKEVLSSNEKIIEVNLSEDMNWDIGAWASNGMGGANTETITINGNGETLYFDETNSDWNKINTNGAKLILNNVVIDKGVDKGNGAWNSWAIQFDCDVEMNDVTIKHSVVFQQDAKLNNVTVEQEGDYYAIMVTAEGQTVTIDGLTVNGARGIKVIDQYISTPAKVTLNVANADFNTTGGKAAILVTSTAGADIALENVDITGVAADSTNAVWVDTDRAAQADLVTVTGGTCIVEP